MTGDLQYCNKQCCSVPTQVIQYLLQQVWIRMADPCDSLNVFKTALRGAKSADLFQNWLGNVGHHFFIRFVGESRPPVMDP